MDKPKPKPTMHVEGEKNPSASKNIFTLASYNAQQLKNQIAAQTRNMASMGIVMKTRAERCVSAYQPHQGNREKARRLKRRGNGS